MPKTDFDFEKDYYAILGVPSTASEDRIREAYHQRMDETSDKSLDRLSPEEEADLKTAFRILGDPILRRQYDRERWTKHFDTRRMMRGDYTPSEQAGLLMRWGIAALVIFVVLLVGMAVAVAVFYQGIDEGVSNTPADVELVPTLPIENALLEQMPIRHNEDWQPVSRQVDSVEMVLVPAGSFIAGQVPASSEDRESQEIMMDAPFWIDKYEVSNAQYNRYVAATYADDAFPCRSRWCEDNRPRESISWQDASAYCAWRGARLPSALEWEYAARGVDSWLYPWGNTFDPARVIYRGTFRREGTSTGNPQTLPVDSLPEGASWVGAVNMLGNVQEWVADNPSGSISRPHILRGGSALNNVLTLLTEDQFGPSDLPDYNGFRCVHN